MLVDNNTLTMVLSFGEEIPSNQIPYYLLRDWKDCTVDGRSLLSIREFCVSPVANVEIKVAQYYVTPIMYALMTGQYELARQLLKRDCDTFFWQPNTYQEDRKDNHTPSRIQIHLPCYLLLREDIPGDLRTLLWNRLDEELQDRDELVFMDTVGINNSQIAFGISMICSNKSWPYVSEHIYLRNIENLIKNHPRVAYKLERGLCKTRMTLVSRMQLHKMLVQLYREDAANLVMLFRLFGIDRDDVTGLQPSTNRGETLKEYCQKHNGVDQLLEYLAYVGKFYQRNVSLRQSFFSYLISFLTFLEEVVSVGECKRIEAFAKVYVEPSCDVEVVATDAVNWQIGSYEIVQRSLFYKRCLDRRMTMSIDTAVSKEYIKRIIGIAGHSTYHNGLTGNQLLKNWLDCFERIQYKTPNALPFSPDVLFSSKDRELVVLAIQKGLLPKERCEQYIAYCMEEHCIEHVPFLLYIRTELIKNTEVN